uniref:hypothetical protein n=1 Tax=Pseudonocardia sp. CA-138482 TaxID=3240023 RepID=UPI003F490DA9
MIPNEALRAARRALPSPHQPGRPASRSELAELDDSLATRRDVPEVAELHDRIGARPATDVGV